MNKAFNQFEIRTDIVVIGHNPEMADFSNRNGAIHGYAAYIEASNDYGDTRQLFIDSSRCEAGVVEKAEKLAKNLTTRFEVLGKLPIGFDNWAEGRARYGSDAWIYYGNSEEFAYEQRELADEQCEGNVYGEY